MDLPFITQLINSRLNATLLGSCPQPTLRCPNLWGSGPRSLFLWSRVGAEGGMAWAHPCSGFSPLTADVCSQHFFQDESRVAISCPVPSPSGLSLPAKKPWTLLTTRVFFSRQWPGVSGVPGISVPQVCHPRPCLHVGGGGLAVMQREASPAGEDPAPLASSTQSQCPLPAPASHSP